MGKQIKIAILVSLFLTCILIILISNFIPIFFEKYHSSVSPSIILILGLPGLSLSFVLSSFYTVIMKQYRLIPIMIIPLLINVVMAWWFFNDGYGLDGFAISTTVSIYLYAIFMLWDYKRIVNA